MPEESETVYGFSESDARQLIDSIEPIVAGTGPPKPQRQLHSALLKVTATAMTGSTPGTGTGRLMQLKLVSSVWTASELSPATDVAVRSYRTAALADAVVLAVREQLTNEWIVC